MNRFLKISTAALLLALSGQSALAQDMLVKEATIVTEDGAQEGMDLLIRGGRIARMGDDLSAPSGTQTVSGDDYWVTPGLFAPYSTLGLVDVGAEAITDDSRGSSVDSSISEMVVDGFNPRSVHIANARRKGVTHALVMSGTNGDSMFGGTGIIINLSGEFDSVVDDAAFVYVDFGEAGSRRSGGSRAGAMQQLRAALYDAAAFPARYDSPTDGDTLSRQDAAAFAPAAGGAIPIIISANRASDLMSLIRLKDEYGELDLIVLGGAESHLVAEELADAGIKVILDPLNNLPQSFEYLDAKMTTAQTLEEAGVDYAIANTSSQGVVKAGGLKQSAGNAVGDDNLTWSQAFAAITSTPASWFGLNNGGIEIGRSANLVVWDGDPLDIKSAAIHMMIDGEPVSLESRQTKLRDRYNPTIESDLPHKYR